MRHLGSMIKNVFFGTNEKKSIHATHAEVCYEPTLGRWSTYATNAVTLAVLVFEIFSHQSAGSCRFPKLPPSPYNTRDIEALGGIRRVGSRDVAHPPQFITFLNNLPRFQKTWTFKV